MANEFKFQPSKISEAVNKKLFIKRLPEWMQGVEQIQMFCDDVIQQWFNPADEEIVDGYIGDRGTPTAEGKIFLNELDLQRQDYQFSPAYVSKNSDNSVRSIQFYSDLVGYLGHYGALTENNNRLLSGYYYSWTPPINPNKLKNYSSYFWDTANVYGVAPDYIVMERGAINNNKWSQQNCWYTIGQKLPDGTLLTEELIHTTRFSRAQAPIIEFNKNIELLNYGSKFRAEVNYLSDRLKPEDIVQKSTEDDVRIDGYILREGDRILFTSIGNPGENNRIYKVHVKHMANNKRVYGLVLDEDEETPEHPTGEPLTGDVVFIQKGNRYGNSTIYWNGHTWVTAQEKPSINSLPLFALYDKNGVRLDSTVTYPGSDFKGSNLFGLKINFNYSSDKVYNKHVEVNENNYYIFENFLQTQRFNYNSGEISGLYFYNVISTDSEGNLVQNLKSDWVRSTEPSKQHVRQIPEIKKLSMYKVFNSVSEMRMYKKAVKDMYAYVIEDDKTYKYFKPENGAFMRWNLVNTAAVQSDMFETTYELAQKIDPANSEEELNVYINGVLTKDYTVNLNSEQNVDSITLDPEVQLTEDSILEINTYSSTKVPDLSLGSYEIPVNLQNNPYNENVDYIHQGDYTLHFHDIIRQNITSGSVDDINDYDLQLEEGNVDNSKGTKIIQNETSLLPLMIHSANENLDLFSAIVFAQYEYFRFKNKFNTLMVKMYNENPGDFLSTTASEIVDNILTSINTGKDDTFAHYLNDIASSNIVSHTYIPATPQFLGIMQAYAPEKAQYLHAGRDIGCYNIDHTGAISKAYHVINGVDHMDDVILELENRIYNSINTEFNNVDYVPVLNSTQLNPTPYYRSTEYTKEEYNELELRGYVNFIASNAIDNSTHEYDHENWMTWNFSGTTYIIDGKPTDIPARGSWRAIYTDMYGTYRPVTHPWEMLGFTQRPSWWNQEYEPTRVQVGPEDNDFVFVYTTYVVNENGDTVATNLWDSNEGPGDVSTGTILSGARKGVYPEFRRFGKQPFELESTGTFAKNGEEIIKIKLISPDILGMISGSITQAQEPWKFGDMGDIEFSYMNTVMYTYDKVLALLRAKPAMFCNYFYDTLGNTLQEVQSGGIQFLYKDTNHRLDLNSSSTVYGENGNNTLGYPSWVSNYLIYQNKSVKTNYGDIIRSSGINVGHRIGGFTKREQLTFSSDTFGLISQENQNIGLVKSSSFRDETLSAVKITYTGKGFIIGGYDLVQAKFKYQNPNKKGRRTTITSGRKTVLHYNEYLDSESEIQYGSVLKTVQEVYSFICSYGEYLEQHGWIFEDTDEDGVTQNWNVIAKNFLDWSDLSLKEGEFISVSPSTKNVKFGTTFGSIQSVTEFNGGVWSLLDSNNSGIRPFEIDTSRIGNVFSVRLHDDIDKNIALVRLSVVSYEHAVVFDDKTIFGNNIYIPKYGVIHEMIKMYGYITGSWNGRLEAPGFIILESGTLPNFEKLVDDFRDYYDNENPSSNVTISNMARQLIGYQTRDYISQMITSDTSKVDFYKGYIKDKGTNRVFEKVLRVSKSYNTENYKQLQEWAFKIGEYGNVDGKKHMQFQLVDNQIQQEPQLFTADEYATQDSTENDIVFFGKQGDDPRWIIRPKGKFQFPQRTGKSTKINLPDIGPVTLNEVSYSTKNFDTAYQDRVRYINTNSKQPESVWMFRDMNELWNVYEIVNTGIKLNSIIPVQNDSDYLGGGHCQLIIDTPHDMEDGDYFYFVDETEYMPDTLKAEIQYFSSGDDKTVITVPMSLANTINFVSDNPVLYRYVERFNSQERQDYIDKKYSYPAPESSYFDKPSIHNSLTNITELYMNVYDPINGVIPGSVMSNVKYISTVDPAKYNTDDITEQAWGKEKVGEVWWDTNNAFFVDYTRPVYSGDVVDEKATLSYKRYNWGKLLPHSEINVYEWVESPVEPYNWDRYCERQAKLNKDSTEWIPSGHAVNEVYSTSREFDTVTNTYKTMYYFWVKNSIYVPKKSSRTRTTNEIARIIANPLLLNVPWFSPVSTNSFIISGIKNEITYNESIMSLTYQETDTEVVKHEQYQLCKEGDDYNFNKTIWDSMWNSLRAVEEYNGTVVELKYPENPTGILPGQTWFMDTIEARRNFVASANKIYKSINVTTDLVLMNDVFNVTIQETNENFINFNVIEVDNTFALDVPDGIFNDNDPVFVQSTGTLPAPLNNYTLYYITTDANGNKQLMETPEVDGIKTFIIITDKGEGTHSIIKQADYINSLQSSTEVVFDMSDYWDYADWYDIGYNEQTTYTDEPSLEAADNKGYQIGDIIRVVGSDGVWTMYIRSMSRNNVIWQAISRQNSTVSLNDKIYTDTNEDNIRTALGLLKNSFNGKQSNLVFDMVKYVHTEQPVVPWVYKTSYIYIIGLEQPLQQNDNNDNLINQIIEYFNEVKPYRTKIRSQIEQKTSAVDEILELSNDLSPDAYQEVNGVQIKVQNDIWDYERAVYNEVDERWEIQGSLPDDFVSPDRSFQESYEMLVFDNFQCTPDSDLPSAAELEVLNKKYQTNVNDLLIPQNSYMLKRYNFTYPETTYDTIESSVLNGLSQIYPDVANNLDIHDVINSKIAEFNDAEQVNEFIANLDNIYKNVSYTDASSTEVRHYSYYNTLANRRRLYTSKTDSEISQEMGCPFKGRVLSDNINMVLPYGFSGSSDANNGYIMQSSELYEKYRSLVKEQFPNSTSSEIDDYLIYEYGLYPWMVDMTSVDPDTGELNGKNYLDTLYVLTGMLNAFNPDELDNYEIARKILANPTYEMYCAVLIPRKHVYVKSLTTNEIYNVDMNTGIQEFINDNLTSIDDNDVSTVEPNVLVLNDINLNDLELDRNNPLYDNIENVLTQGRSMFNDNPNGFDNYGLESQTSRITKYSTGDINENDSVFVDISELNPFGVELSQMRFTVKGYGFNTSANVQLKNSGNFQVEGYITQNPYNSKEVILSIPRYEDAELYMSSVLNKPEIKYTYRIKDILDTDGVCTLLQDHDLRIGDTVMVFVPEGLDYEITDENGNWSTILEVDNIKDGLRPRMFTISDVQGQNITIDGLVFTGTYSSAEYSINTSTKPTAISVVRISSFSDDSFVSDNVKLYSDDRSYTIDIMNYNNFYDRMLNEGSFTDSTEPDVHYVSNETSIVDGIDIDHGFYLPVYGSGVLSELVKSTVYDDVVINVYEYPDISPVLNNGVWEYDGTLVDGVYINDKNAKLTTVIIDELNEDRYVYTPLDVVESTITDGVITYTNSNLNDIVQIQNELVQVKNNNHVLRGLYGTVEYDFKVGESYTNTSIVTSGDSLIKYRNNYNIIPLEVFEYGLEIDGTTIEKLM